MARLQIRGQVDRGTGLLNNTLYIGQLPGTAAAISRIRGPARRTRRHPPRSGRRYWSTDVRILDDALWQQVKKRQAGVRFEISRDTTGNALNWFTGVKFLPRAAC